MIIELIAFGLFVAAICAFSSFDTYRNRDYIVKPDDYLHRPFFRRSFYRYPFFKKRYVTRPVLDGLV